MTDVYGVFLVMVVVFVFGEAVRDRELYCAVCRVLVDEINYSISQVDPKKTVQVGSFRVDSKGNQAIYERPYARSETHLTELMESVCEKINDYAQTTDDKGRKSIVRTSSRDGKPLSLRNIEINRDIQEKMRFYCDTVIEEHEEALVALFARENVKDIERVICGDKAAACSEAELNEPLATLKAEEDAESIIEDVEDNGDENNGDENNGDSEEGGGDGAKDENHEEYTDKHPKEEL